MIAEIRNGYLVWLMGSSGPDGYWREFKSWVIVEILPVACAPAVKSLRSLKQPEPMLTRFGRERFVQDRVSGTGVFARVFSASIESLRSQVFVGELL